MTILNFSVLRLPKALFYLVFIPLLLTTILPVELLAASKKSGAATAADDSSVPAVVAYVDASPDTESFTTIAVESERTRKSAMKPDPVIPARRISQTSVIVDAWPTQVNQGETLLGLFRGSNTGTASGGPFLVSQFKIKVTIPPELTLTNQTSTMGTWTVQNQVATLDVGNFAAGQEFSFTMEFEATGFGAVTLQIDVEQFEFHPGPTNFNCPVQITVTPIAYVDASAVGPGGVGNPNAPFPGVLEALDALRIISADDKRICIVPASYPGMAVFDFELEMRTWNGVAGASRELDIPGEVRLPDGARLDVDTGGDVNLGPDGLGPPGEAVFEIDTTLEIIRGDFVTNGLLDIGNGTQIGLGDGELRTGGTGRLVFPTETLGGVFDVGDDGIDLLYFGTTDRTVGLEWPPSDASPTEDPNIRDTIRDVTINPRNPDDSFVLDLVQNTPYSFNRDLIIGGDGPGQSNAGGSDVGTLDLLDGTLEINATNGNDTVLEVHNGADLAGSAGGLVRFIGGDHTDVWVETDGDRLRFDFPAIEVDRAGVGPGDDPRVTFDAEGVLSDAPAGMPANNPDVIGTSSFRLILGGTADGVPGGAGVELLDGLDIFDVGGQYEQFDGEFLMGGLSSISPDPAQDFVQKVRVGFSREPNDMIIEDGEFFGAGGDVEVFGDFCLGCAPPATNNASPKDGLFSLAMNGTHTVVGDFTVGPDTDPSDGPTVDPENRNRYYLGGECGVLPDKGGLFLDGNYRFDGTGDRFDDLDFLPEEQGLRGNVFFVGTVEQTVWHRQDEDAFFCDVVLASRGTDNDGVELLSDVSQNRDGTLTLERGIIDSGPDTNDEQWDWIILNPGIERDLVDRNNSARGDGVIDLGSRDSYINGGVQRVVEKGNAGGGIVTGGYLFPVGCRGDSSTGNCNDPTGARDVDFFRPLILQFPDDLGQSSLARVDYRQDLQPQDLEFDKLQVDAAGGGTLTLDVLSDQFWQLEFDRIPSFDPNIRVEADGLPNIFDIKSLRLIQWDCDGTNLHLAGVYDLDGVPSDPGSFILNEFIDNVPNLSQEGVDVTDCQIIGIASNFLINPIGPEPGILNPLSLTKSFTDDPVPPGGTVTLEFTIGHDGSTDGSATGIAFTDDLGAALSGLEAAGLPANDVCGTGSQLSGTSTLMLSGGSLAANLTCTFSVSLEVPSDAPDGVYANITGEIESMVNAQTVTGPRASDILTVSGPPPPPQADFSITKTADNPEVTLGALINFTVTVTNNGPDSGSAQVVDTLPDNVNFDMAIGDCTESNGVVTCNTGMLASSGSISFTITAQAAQNAATSNTATVSTVPPVEDPNVSNNTASVAIKTDVTDTSADLPTEFALLPNYPNPFNPTTTIQYEIPSTAGVRIAVFDLMGREIAVLVDEVKPAGKFEVILNTGRLTSGTYLYRMSSGTFTQTRSFVLLK